MFDHLPSSVEIVEVAPRDGLQNESSILSTAVKLEFIKLLVAAGIKTIEPTSFVRPSQIPQMADATEVMQGLGGNNRRDIHFPCLVPNMKGLKQALAVNVSDVALFTGTSDSFNQKNINATRAESLERLESVAKLAREKGVAMRGHISTVFGCPYEGETSIEVLKETVGKLQEMGVYQVSLGDTIGHANPLQVQNILKSLLSDFSPAFFALHFHDTRGMAVANIVAALEMGITHFDSSAGGLGGCPYAAGATGNVATEDLVYLCDSLKIKTGVNMEKLVQASTFILKKLGKTAASKYLKAYLAERTQKQERKDHGR